MARSACSAVRWAISGGLSMKRGRPSTTVVSLWKACALSWARALASIAAVVLVRAPAMSLTRVSASSAVTRENHTSRLVMVA